MLGSVLEETRGIRIITELGYIRQINWPRDLPSYYVAFSNTVFIADGFRTLLRRLPPGVQILRA